jgi:NADH-quinone oxidoreductase subunit N
VGLTIVGLSFKVAAVPFHQWVPDVYEGAPTTVSGFMSTAAKAAAFSAFVLVLASVYGGNGNVKTVLALLSVISMVIGNLFAISQTNIKRMLAYSSIAHAGYMLAGLAAGNALGRTGVLFYMALYTLMNLGAFGIIALLEYDEDKNLLLSDYAGLSARRPYLAGLMAVFMFSLSGLPPFGGFFGKYYIFLAAINANLTWLAIAGVLASLIGVYYYIRVVVMMYFSDGRTGDEILPSPISLGVMTLLALLVLSVGVYPSALLSIIQHLF